MGKQFLVIFTIFYACVLNAQSHEIGFFLGGTNYVGDIGRTDYIRPNKVGGGFVYKYNLNPRIALRANYNYLPISGDDADATNPYRQQRPNGVSYKFDNTVHEFAAGVEFNFFEYNIDHYKTIFTPYIFAQTAGFNYRKPERLLSNGDIETSRSFSYTLPVGIGIKGKLTGKFAYALEAGARFTLVDDLDFNTDLIDDLNFGGNGNDWYFFTGFSIVYTFGKPACYNGLTQ